MLAATYELLAKLATELQDELQTGLTSFSTPEPGKLLHVPTSVIWDAVGAATVEGITMATAGTKNLLATVRYTYWGQAASMRHQLTVEERHTGHVHVFLSGASVPELIGLASYALEADSPERIALNTKTIPLVSVFRIADRHKILLQHATFTSSQVTPP